MVDSPGGTPGRVWRRFPQLAVAAMKHWAGGRSHLPMRPLDLALLAYLTHRDDLAKAHDPEAFVEFVRGCLESINYSISWVKRGATNDIPGQRFMTGVSMLERRVPSMSLPEASRIALAADELAADATLTEAWGRPVDVGSHFTMSSSPPRKGRLLFGLVRSAQAQSCLELGTAYGLSALFMAAASPEETPCRIDTIEFYEQQFSIAQDLVGRLAPRKVYCHQGLTTEVIPKLDLVDKVGFVFHDANHTRQAYIEDFGAFEPLLTSGAFVLFDDIRWDNPIPESAPSETYEGWMEVVRHPRVVRAVEIDGELGLLQVR